MQENLYCISALVVNASEWQGALETMSALRSQARQAYGMYVRREFHTSEFLGGRGKYFPMTVSKAERARIYKRMLEGSLAACDIKVFNVVTPKKKVDWGFERLLNRIQRNLDDDDGMFLLLCDEGKEQFFRGISRKLRRHNPIPSRYGSGYRNMPVTRLIEDPVFLQSDRSLFIQLADMVAYALLLSERPKVVDPLGLNEVFEEIVAPYCVTKANANDPLGIVRVV
jgi:hypothetical protein